MLLIGLATAVTCYVIACIALWIGQIHLVYFPGPPPTTEPKDHGLEGQALFLKTDDGERIYAWIVPAKEARGLVIVCHGNAGNVEDRAEYARAFRALGFTTLLFDYRGYGASSGSPGEDGTYRDAEAAFDYATRALGFESAQIALFGESLGGGVAVELATRHAVGALILQDTFTSVPDIGAAQYPWLPVRLLARVHYDNLAKIGLVTARVLLLHSRGDELIPYAHAERLLAAAMPEKRLVTTAGSHNAASFFTNEDWTRQVKYELDRMLEHKGGSR